MAVAYYQGDYYQGDYYSGDPFLGALIGMGASWLGKKLLGKGAKTAGTAMVKSTTSPWGKAGALAAGAAVGSGLSIPIPFTPFQTTPGDFLPGGQPFISRRPAPFVGPPAPGMAGACPSGYHLNKARSCDGRPAGTYMVRNRSMNVANPRALRRSLRRVAGFGKLAQRSKKDIRRAAKAIGA